MTAVMQRTIRPAFILILLALAILFATSSTQLNFHSFLRHGSDGDLCRNGDHIATGRTQDGKLVCVYHVGPKQYGLEFKVHCGNGTFRECTTFIYRKAKGATLRQVLDYLVRQNVDVYWKAPLFLRLIDFLGE